MQPSYGRLHSPQIKSVQAGMTESRPSEARGWIICNRAETCRVEVFQKAYGRVSWQVLTCCEKRGGVTSEFVACKQSNGFCPHEARVLVIPLPDACDSREAEAHSCALIGWCAAPMLMMADDPRSRETASVSVDKYSPRPDLKETAHSTSAFSPICPPVASSTTTSGSHSSRGPVISSQGQTQIQRWSSNSACV